MVHSVVTKTANHFGLGLILALSLSSHSFAGIINIAQNQPILLNVSHLAESHSLSKADEICRSNGYVNLAAEVDLNNLGLTEPFKLVKLGNKVGFQPLYCESIGPVGKKIDLFRPVSQFREMQDTPLCTSNTSSVNELLSGSGQNEKNLKEMVSRLRKFVESQKNEKLETQPVTKNATHLQPQHAPQGSSALEIKPQVAIHSKFASAGSVNALRGLFGPKEVAAQKEIKVSAEKQPQKKSASTKPTIQIASPAAPQVELVPTEEFLDPNSDQFVSQALGFKNFGSTCYANSAFKLLAAIPNIENLTRIQPLHQEVAAGEVDKNAKLRARLHNLVLAYQERKKQALKNPQKNTVKDNKYFEAQLKGTLEAYQALHPNFNIYHQQDSSAFLLSLLEHLGAEHLYSGYHPVSQYKLSNQTYQKGVKEPQNSAIPLSIEDPSVTSVQSALNHYQSADEIDLQSVGAIEKRNFFSAGERGQPQALMVNLRRGDREGQVNHKAIQITDVLQVPFVKENTLNKKTPTFENVAMYLKSIVVHHGDTATSGHYYIYTYDKDKQSWFKNNDSQITLLSGAALVEAYDDMEKNAVNLLYTRVQ